MKTVMAINAANSRKLVVRAPPTSKINAIDSRLHVNAAAEAGAEERRNVQLESDMKCTVESVCYKKLVLHVHTGRDERASTTAQPARFAVPDNKADVNNY